MSDFKQRLKTKQTLDTRCFGAAEADASGVPAGSSAGAAAADAVVSGAARGSAADAADHAKNAGYDEDSTKQSDLLIA